MLGYHLKFDQKRLQSAYGNLTIGELYSYIFITFAIKNGLSAEDSKRYGLDESDLFKSLIKYGYKKSEKTFFRHLKTLRLKNYVSVDEDKTKFFDVHHRHDAKNKDQFVLVDYADLALSLKSMSQQSLKFFIGYKMNEYYLSKKKPFGKLRSKARLEKKVLNFTNRKNFYQAKKDFEALKGQKCNRLIDLTDQIKEVLSQKCNRIEYKTALKESNKSARKVNFKKLEINYHTLHLINWHRSKLGKRKKTYSEFQTAIDEFTFAMEKKLIKAKKVEGLFFHHLKNFETSILNDEQISGYRHESTGFEKQSTSDGDSFGAFVKGPEERTETFASRVEEHLASKSEKTKALEMLFEEKPFLKQTLNWNLSLKEKAGFFKHWYEKIEELASKQRTA